MGVLGNFLAGMVITSEFAAAKREGEANRAAREAANAQTAALQQMQSNVLASQEYIARLDDEIRKNLPDTFVRYCYKTGWHTWYIDPSLSVSVTVNKKKGTVREFTINGTAGIGERHPFDLEDPVGFARMITGHIAKALERPMV
jgi:hypothetical protein